MLTPLMALATLTTVAVSGGEAAGTPAPNHNAQPTVIHIAALQAAPDTLSDACVWSPEAASAGETDQCGAPSHGLTAQKTGQAPERALVWPDDFLALTTGAVVEAWDAAVGFIFDLYEYAFDSDETPPKAGS